jgi:hypothetical protein
VSQRRCNWRPIAGTPARAAWRRVERESVRVLCVRLDGWVDRRAEEVRRVRDGLDALATRLGDVEVCTLDVRRFANAPGDECQILTGVFAGAPCCWISSAWDQQHDGQRWDLPEPEMLAADGRTALTRVVGWRRAGEVSLRLGGGRDTRTWRFEPRGLTVTTTRDGAPDLEDLYVRNRLVERTIHGEAVRRVTWPIAEASGVTREALRHGARLVVERGRVVEVGYTKWETELPLADGWLARLAELTDVRRVDLRTTTARAEELVRVVEVSPALEELWADRAALDAAALAKIRALRPALVLRLL